ncbi:MAG: hypothetical protein HC837_19230, partial [Chloroflexaceae bacterium]|nr:hypothetical protein [Chloroflexaceae bacterium]
WRLAAMVNQADVEQRLRTYPLTDHQRQSSSLTRIEVWQPHDDEPDDSALPAMMSRVVWLIEHAPDETIPPSPFAIDPRILIPRLFQQSPLVPYAHTSRQHR